MSSSLRTRLLVSTAAGAGAVFIITGLCINWLIANSLRQEFDQALVGKARALSALVEEEDGRIEFESDLNILPELRPGAAAEFLELRHQQGPIAYRSPSLTQHDIAWPDRADATPRMDNLTLPDGRIGRRVAFSFHPRHGADESVSPERAGAPVAEIILARGSERLRTQLARFALLLCAAVAGALLALIAILDRLVRRGLMPLRSLAAQIEQIDPNDLSNCVEVPGSVDELAPVTRTLNDLLGRLNAAFDREKALTADVAHELRTPLAGLRSTIDVALLRDRTPDEYRQMLTRGLGVIVQLQEMVEGLLTLARAEGGLTELTLERVNWSELVAACWTPLAQQATEKGLVATLEIPPGIETQSNRQACAQVLRNLLENAVTYANSGGQLAVRAQEQNDRIALQISNTGCRLSDDQMRHVFDRFWRADPVRGQDDAHHGLGLALVQRLVSTMGGRVQANRDGDLFCVEMTLPSRRPGPESHG